MRMYPRSCSIQIMIWVSSAVRMICKNLEVNVDVANTVMVQEGSLFDIGMLVLENRADRRKPKLRLCEVVKNDSDFHTLTTFFKGIAVSTLISQVTTCFVRSDQKYRSKYQMVEHSASKRLRPTQGTKSSPTMTES